MPEINPLTFPLTIHPVTPDRWPDMQKLFGPRGACGGCWCMFWRQTRSEYEKFKGEPNRLSMQVLIESGEIPGLLAYLSSPMENTPAVPVGWVSVAPRPNFSALERSRVLKPVDDLPVWSIVCFFVPRKFRRQGITVQLIRAAVHFASSNGAKIIEGYPVESRSGSIPDAFAYMGLPSAFEKAGFREVARRSETRPMMRFFVGDAQ